MKKLARFFVGVKKEMGKVKWPTKKELVSNSVAAISFMIVFALFFTLADIAISALRTVIG